MRQKVLHGCSSWCPSLLPRQQQGPEQCFSPPRCFSHSFLCPLPPSHLPCVDKKSKEAKTRGYHASGWSSWEEGCRKEGTPLLRTRMPLPPISAYRWALCRLWGMAEPRAAHSEMASSPGPGCPGRLWSLLLWRYSRPAWTWSCAACSG